MDVGVDQGWFAKSEIRAASAASATGICTCAGALFVRRPTPAPALFLSSETGLAADVRENNRWRRGY